MIFSTPIQISVADVPPEVSSRTGVNPSREPFALEKAITLKKAARDYERHLITEALNRHGSTSEAVRALGIDPTTLTHKLKYKE